MRWRPHERFRWGAGFLISTLAIVLSIGILSAASQLPSDPQYAGAAAFEGAAWANLQGTISGFAYGFMGVGFLILGWLVIGSRTVPSWLGVVGLVGGVGALVAIVVDAAAILPFAAIVVWGLVVGGTLLIRGNQAPAIK